MKMASLRTWKGLSILVALTLVLALGIVAVPMARADEATGAQVLEAYGGLPISFIQNQGQLDARVEYYVKADEQTLYLTGENVVFDLIRYEGAEEADLADRKAQRLVYSLDFLGANKSPVIEGRDKDKAIVNYFIGNDPEKWHSNIPTYREVVYKDIYPGIDLRLYGKEGLLEYEFVVEPGASVAEIRLAYDGVDSVVIEDGELVASTAFGDMKQTPPYIYQQIGDDEAEVDGGFKLISSNIYGFEVAAYDASYPLIIDPGLAYSTYLGGNDFDNGQAIAIESGFAYVTGLTCSTTVPTKNQYQTDPGDSNYDGFVAKMDTTKSGLASLTAPTLAAMPASMGKA